MLQKDLVGSLRDSKTGELVNPVRRQNNAAMKFLGIKSGKTFRRFAKRVRRENRENAI